MVTGFALFVNVARNDGFASAYLSLSCCGMFIFAFVVIHWRRDAAEAVTGSCGTPTRVVCSGWRRLVAVRTSGTRDADGVHGTFRRVLDVATGAWSNRFTNIAFAESDGFDGAVPWCSIIRAHRMRSMHAVHWHLHAPMRGSDAAVGVP